MRILVESFDLDDLGGSGTSLRFFVEEWRARGAEIAAFGAVLDLEQTRRLAPDLIVTQQWARGPAAAVADALRIPLVVLVHGPGQFAPTPMSRMVLFCSDELADAEPAVHMEGRESVVVASPVDPARHVVDGGSGRGEYLTLMSSDDHVKGVDRFLAFAADVTEHSFLLVSDGEHARVPDNVTVRRRSRDVGPIYADTMLLLLPSRRDSAPRVVVEAALRGIPTLASDLVSIHQMSFGLTRVVAQGEDWASEIRRAVADIEELRQDAAELAQRYLARQEVQLDDCWHRMEALVAARAHDALLGLVMIVKDEARGIRATLESVRPGVDWWTIVDTGSTDGTQGIVQEVMAGVPGELRRASFVDFGTTRNLALAYCEPRSRFQLMLSGDEVVEGAFALRQFCLERREHTAQDPGAYDLAVQFGASTTYKSPRLTRAGMGWRYEGVTHEVLVSPRGMPAAGPPGVLIKHDRDRGSEDEGASAPRRDVVGAQQRRWRQDLELLRGAAKEKSDDTRTAFYLAQTLECLQMNKEALAAYERRVAMGGWQEEVYESLVRIARLRDVVGHSWPQVQQSYLDAHSHSPHRAEPLVGVAKHWYDEGNHALSFLFAQRASQIPYPAQSRLFVDAETYRHKAHDLVGVAAYYLGLYGVGRAATEAALRACPDDARLRRNLGFYEAREARDPGAFYRQVNEVSDYGGRVELFRTWGANRKVLHIGCADVPVFDPANNLHMQIASATREIVGVDVSEEGLEELRGHLPGRYYTDVGQVADEHFDLVLVPETIEHLGDPAAMLKEILGRLAFTTIVITAPSFHYWAQHSRYEGGRFHETVHPDHYAWYSPSTLKRLLREVLSPDDAAELFFVNGQSMVGARVTRLAGLARRLVEGDPSLTRGIVDQRDRTSR